MSDLTKLKDALLRLEWLALAVRHGVALEHIGGAFYYTQWNIGENIGPFYDLGHAAYDALERLNLIDGESA